MTGKKLYCYVDETGQDTKGDIFIVSVIVVENNREEIVKKLVEIEQQTGKKTTKWNHSKRNKKESYMQAIFETPLFCHTIYYSFFRQKTAYQELTVLSIAAAIYASKYEKYKASVFIDGLRRKEVLTVGSHLRKIGIHTEKVRGVRDESNAIIRLADAIAGFVREYQENAVYAKRLYSLGLKNKILQKE